MRETADKMTAVALGLVVSVLLFSPITARGGASLPPLLLQGPAHEAPPPPRRDRREGRLLARLNLSPQQREQIGAVRRRSAAETRLLAQRLRQARRALDDSIYADQVDEKIVEERAREVAAAQAEMVRLRALTELELRRVLTPEQLTILRDERRVMRSAPGHHSAATGHRGAKATSGDDTAPLPPAMHRREALRNRRRHRRNVPPADPNRPIAPITPRERP